MPDVQSMLVLSTGHLSPKTLEWLDTMNWETEGPFGGKIHYGYFMYAADENVCDSEGRPFPPDLWHCFRAAQKLNVGYIRFDCDVEPDTSLGLNVYDHSKGPGP